MTSGRMQADLQANIVPPPDPTRPLDGDGRLSSVFHAERLLTLEIALYLGAVLLGVLLRLLLLDQRPLSAEEGRLASQSYRFMLGQTPGNLLDGPLQTYGTALALGLFGGGDGAARLFSALAGSLLVAAPYAIRGAVGRSAAILAAYGFALSPLLLFASREVGSGIIPTALSLFVWWAFPAALKLGSGRGPYVVALLIGGLVACGPAGLTVLLTLGLAAVLSEPNPSLLVAEVRQGWTSVTWKRAGLMFLAVVLALATAFGANLRGVQSVLVDGWLGWLGSFSLGSSRGALLLAIVLYELPIVILAAGRLWVTVRARERTDIFLSIWAMLLLLIGLLQSPITLSHMVLPLVPLYLLAARVVAAGVPRMTAATVDWRWVVASVGLASPLLVAIVLLNRTAVLGEVIPQPYLGGEVALVVAGCVLFAVILDGKGRLSAGLVGGAVLGIAFLVHSSVFLNYRTESISREPVAGQQISPVLRNVATEAGYFSDYFESGVAVDPQLRSALEWYLRDAPGVRFGAGGTDGISIQLAQSSQAAPGDAERAAGVYAPTIDAGRLSWRGIWAWLMTRDGLVQANQRDIIFRAPAGNW